MTRRSVSSRSASPHLGSVFVGALSGAIAATIVVLVLLSGFGLAPPRVFGNPLGVDGAPVRVQIGGDSRTATAVGSVRGGVDDIATLLPPERFALEQVLAGSATVTAPAGSELPDTIALTDLVLDVTVSDARGSTTFKLLPSGDALLIRTSGGYALTPVAFSALLSGPQMGRLHPILTGGGANTVVVALSLTAASTPPLPSGSSVELAFGGGSGTIGF